MSKYLSIVFLFAYAEARFGQEQVPVSAVSSLSSFGQSGQAATLAGAVPGVLLAAANPCAKLTLADQIVTTLGNDPAVIQGAAAVVAAEQNFNPFNVDVPSICDDATLPATAELRGVIPLVDPAVTGSDVENANSATSLTTPFDATGLSVAGVMQAQGFSNFTAVDASGNKAAANANAAAPAANNSTSSASSSSNAGAAAAAAANSTVTSGTNSTAGSTTSIAGADFGLCTPTMDFQLGRPGRKATEGTFLPTDALVAKGQQDALNPNIITNRICDQLTNVCNANQAAKDACASAKTLVSGLGTKDQTTADAFNQALGF
ncbi:hypothetical protein N0V82_000872 [Gnomoniopsis sp. IMI 355080]|nr:hypothetical protein N0V82_000872 [Gnomoniopsis sp. IMI 355080]